MTKTMTIREFMSKTQSNNEGLSILESQQYELMKLTLKAFLILSAAVLPLQLDQLLNLTNGVLEAYLNQFNVNGIESFLNIIK